MNILTYSHGDSIVNRVRASISRTNFGQTSTFIAEKTGLTKDQVIRAISSLNIQKEVELLYRIGRTTNSIGLYRMTQKGREVWEKIQEIQNAEHKNEV